MNSTLKLQAFLAHAGISSRREAEKLIEKGLISVNGQKAHTGQRINPAKDHVVYKHQVITLQQPLEYYLVNKPINVVSTTQDELGRETVLDLIPKTESDVRLYPVGRLDHDSQGLMLLTNDGDLAYKLTHPSFKIDKMYYVELDRPPTDNALDHLRRGVKLNDGFTQSAKVELLPERGDTWISITLHEGRNRQVRRMMERSGYQVVNLIRVTMGPFSLKQLHNRRFYKLTADEALEARQKVGLH